jgi:hypothetical protein
MEDRMLQIRTDLAHIDATLRLSDPSINLSGIMDKMPQVQGGVGSARRCYRRVGDVVSADYMVRHTMTKKGLTRPIGIAVGPSV